MIKKDKYEISVWEDLPVTDSKTSKEYYKEKKTAVIGSDTMTAQARAREPMLRENINGTTTFTFTMYDSYINNKTGLREKNPFVPLLFNERKIKVYWKNKWYDMIIKRITEMSTNNAFKYECSDLYINELSKTGFNLEFHDDLRNNQGTIYELGERVLTGSDWRINQDEQDPTQIIRQEREEPVYEMTGVELPNSFTAQGLDRTVTIKSTDKILLFYSVVQNQSSYAQFVYEKDGAFKVENGYQLLSESPNYSVEVEWVDEDPDYYLALYSGKVIFKISKQKQVSSQYRAKRLVRTQVSELDPVFGEVVNVYSYINDKGAEEKVYGYQEITYKDPTIVNNLAINSQNFSSTQGWSGGSLQFTLYPKFDENATIDYEAKSYLKFSGTSGSPISYLNNGIRESSAYLREGFSKSEKYIVRYKAMSGGNEPSGTYIIKGLLPKVCYYTENTNGTYTRGADVFTVKQLNLNDKWVEYELTCAQSVPRQELLTKKIGLFLVSSGNYWLEQIEFFPLVYGEELDGTTSRINPGELDKQSIARTTYRYYSATRKFLSKDQIEFLYSGYEDWDEPTLKKVYNENFEKIRSIDAENSNRFNLLQTLAETFGCWARFTIEHNEETGEVLYDEWLRPKKWVSFHTEIGQTNGLVFEYGVDLNSIQRTINSDQITTKLVVSPNNNEFGEDGMCLIARSKENYSKENFILNFDYYIKQGLLDSGILNRDLYQSVDSIGYYYWLHKYNEEYDGLSKEISAKSMEVTKQESMLQTYHQNITATNEEIDSLEAQIKSLAGVSTMEAAMRYIAKKPDDTKVKTLIARRANLMNNRERLLKQQNGLEQSLDKLKEYVTLREDRQEELIDKLDEKHEEFYNKYSRFIQEGSWISEDYSDDNLYYLDAQDILYTSSRPQIAYTISVLRLSALDQFKYKVFNLGDISHIQDPEFFGYTWIDGIKTPYKEMVLISEVTSFFDTPEQDSFSVQNYKTQFEDLFQRITATTQGLQYARGEYQKVANAFTPTGELKPLTLQNSFLLNQDLVVNAQNESVIYDSTGITVSDVSNPNKKVKVTSGGIFITNDGGISWKSAIRGDGISTQYLTAGAINTSDITIMNGNYTAFRWDGSGINAYWNSPNIGTMTNKFVRFDQYGIYGVNSWTPEQTDAGETYDPNVVTDGLSGEDKIWKDAQFAMTWKGFLMRNKHGNGYVEVSSEKDIVVNDGKRDRINIGNLGSASTPVYGIRISDGSGAIVMETTDDGSLWLKDKLHISTTDNQQVLIGRLSGVKSGTDIREVINANDNFIVYEDGSILGTKVNFTGGTIGGLTINQITNSSKDVSIGAPLGNSIKVKSDGSYSPAEGLTLEAKLLNVATTGRYTWSYSTDSLNWNLLGSTETVKIPYNKNYFDNNGTGFIRLIYNCADGEFTTYQTIYIVNDGSDAKTVVIESSEGNTFKNGVGSTTLTARLFKGGVEIDMLAPYNYIYTWTKWENGAQVSSFIKRTKSIEVTDLDVGLQSTFRVEVEEG